MQLYAFPASPRARKPMAVAHHLGLPFELVFLNLLAGDQKKPGYLKVNPKGKMPTLVDGDIVIWEANAIIQHLADKKPGALMPTDARGRAHTAQWLLWDMAHWDAANAILIFENMLKKLIAKGAPPDAARVKEGEDKFHAVAGVLDGHLAHRDWIVGDALSVVDFALAAPLHYAEAAKIPVGKYANVRKWYARVESLPAWQKSAPPAFG